MFLQIDTGVVACIIHTQLGSGIGGYQPGNAEGSYSVITATANSNTHSAGMGPGFQFKIKRFIVCGNGCDFS